MADYFVRDANLVLLMEKTGYNIIQENGQRKFGPPPAWIGPPPPKGSEIFIGKLPRDVFEDELVPLCEPFGKIYELRLMMDYNGENRGYAFVTYTNNDDSTKAIKSLDDFEIRPGRHIGVCKSVDNCRLFVGGIPKDKSKDEIMTEISIFTEGVSNVILYSSITDKSQNRGFAFVEYETHRAAAMARRKLLAGKVKLFDYDIAVDWAQPEAQVEEETMRRFLKSLGKRQMGVTYRVTVLYVRNLSNKTTEEQLHVVFSMGGILKLERVKKLRDFAFIHYYKREDAETALERFHGMFLDGCILEVTWAKPPEAHKQKMLLQKDPASSLYRQLNFDNLDHQNFASNMHQNSSLPNFSLVSRSNLKPRLQMSNSGHMPSTFSVTKPVQLLHFLCAENSWGQPSYQIAKIDSDPTEKLYICWILIPNMPDRFMCPVKCRVCRSEDEAKHYAASHVLKKLGVIDTDFPFIGSPRSLPMTSNFSNVPKNYLPPSNSLVAPKPNTDFPVVGSSSSLPVTSSFSNVPKNYFSPNSSPAMLKTSPSTCGLFSPSKNNSFLHMENPIPSSNPYLFEHGKGDAHSFLSNIAPMDSFDANDIENCPPLFDADTPIEPNSILGLLSSLAATSNVDLPLFNNKPKL